MGKLLGLWREQKGNGPGGAKGPRVPLPKPVGKDGKPIPQAELSAQAKARVEELAKMGACLSELSELSVVSCVWWTVRGGRIGGVVVFFFACVPRPWQGNVFLVVGIGTVVAWVFGEARRLGNVLISNGFGERNGREVGGGYVL